MIMNHKSFGVIAVAMSFVIFATPLLAQYGSLSDLEAGSIAGEQAARASVNGQLWFLIGCLGGWIGLVVSYIYEPNPPALHLLGKSPEYVAAYTDAYRATARSIQSNKAITGCIVAGISYLALTAAYIVLVAAVAASSTTY